jgi:cell division protein FtsA
MPGMLAHAQDELAASVRIAIPDYIGVRDPSYTSGVGIIQFVSKSVKNRSTGYVKSTTSKKSDKKKTNLVEKFKNWLSDYI